MVRTKTVNTPWISRQAGQIWKGPRASPEMPRRRGRESGRSTFAQERKARALVHADLPVLRHFVHRFAALRLPLTEEVDRHFRSLLQFHVSRVQRPSLVRVRHVYHVPPYSRGVKSVSLQETCRTNCPRQLL